MCPCHSVKRSDPSFSGLWANLLLLIDLLLLLIVGVLHLHLTQVTMMVQRSMTSVFLFNIKVNWPSSLFQTSLVKYGLVTCICSSLMCMMWRGINMNYHCTIQLVCVHICMCNIYIHPWLWDSWQPNRQEWVSWRLFLTAYRQVFSLGHPRISRQELPLGKRSRWLADRKNGSFLTTQSYRQFPDS